MGATIQEGFLFRSSTAWARLTPIGSESVIRTPGEWYEQFNIVWATP